MKLLPYQERMMKIIKDPNAKLFLYYRRGKSRAELLLQEILRKAQEK
jgi:hypothetical protein